MGQIMVDISEQRRRKQILNRINSSDRKKIQETLVLCSAFNWICIYSSSEEKSSTLTQIPSPQCIEESCQIKQ